MTTRCHGFSAIELTVAIAMVGLLFAIAIPMFGALRMTSAFSSGEQAVRGLLARARWSAINSGRAETRVHVEGHLLRVRAGTAADAPILASIDASEYDLALSGANLPIRLDPRGIRLNAAGSIPAVTIRNSRISSSTTFEIDPLGRAVVP